MTLICVQDVFVNSYGKLKQKYPTHLEIIQNFQGIIETNMCDIDLSTDKMQIAWSSGEVHDITPIQSLSRMR